MQRLLIATLSTLVLAAATPVYAGESATVSPNLNSVV
jgi:hypothetical protein